MSGFSVGNCFTKSFSIFGKNLVTFLALVVLFRLPNLLANVFFEEDLVAAITNFLRDRLDVRAAQARESAPALTQALFALLDLPVTLMATGVVVYGVLQHMRGRRPGLFNSLKVTLSRAVLIPVLATLQSIFVAIGAMACIIPGFMIACAYYVALPVFVVERRGVFASLKRSWQLTHGARLSIFGVMVVLYVMQLLVGFGLGAIVAAGGVADDTSLLWIQTLATWVIQIPFIALYAVTVAVTYHDLRTEREGATSQGLAAVFD